MVLVLTSKAGGCRLLSGFYTGIDPACPAVELYAKRVNKNMKLLSQVDLESLELLEENSTYKSTLQVKKDNQYSLF